MLGTLRPWNCSPKNNVILCGPRDLLLLNSSQSPLQQADGGGGGAGFQLPQVASLMSALPANAKPWPSASSSSPSVPSASQTNRRQREAPEQQPGSETGHLAAAPGQAAGGGAEWYPSLGQRVWALPTGGVGGKWAGVVVACGGEKWQIAPELQNEELSALEEAVAAHTVEGGAACGAKSALFGPFYAENDHFAETGSGQS
jgi:hypothetical protein